MISCMELSKFCRKVAANGWTHAANDALVLYGNSKWKLLIKLVTFSKIAPLSPQLGPHPVMQSGGPRAKGATKTDK